MTAITLRHLSHRFGRVAAVNDLNLELAPGELVALLGSSGCGKSTTLRMIAGLLSPATGDILFDGRSVLRVPAEQRGAVMVFQRHTLFPHMTVAQNIGFGLRMRGVPKPEIAARVRDMLALVRLPGFEDRQPHELSGGQQQRASLARALVVRPNVLLLDEPLANLDAGLRQEMRELIRTIQQEMGITSLFVTHDQEEAVMLADRVALMSEGRLLQCDTPRGLYERPRSAAVARFLRNENFLEAAKCGRILRTSQGCLKAARADAQPDGPVLLTIRPEDVVIGGSADNTVCGVLTGVVYLGTYTRLQIRVAERNWHVNGPADFAGHPGEQINLYLPEHRIWLLPPAGTQIQESEMAGGLPA